jgi:hypothetical protein
MNQRRKRQDFTAGRNIFLPGDTAWIDDLLLMIHTQHNTTREIFKLKSQNTQHTGKETHNSHTDSSIQFWLTFNYLVLSTQFSGQSLFGLGKIAARPTSTIWISSRSTYSTEHSPTCAAKCLTAFSAGLPARFVLLLS